MDTEFPSFQGWSELYEAHGCVLSMLTYAKHVGSPGAYDLFAHLEAQVGRSLDRVMLTEKRRQRYYELTVGQQPFPGVQDYLADARRHGLTLGIASGSQRGWVEDHLHRFDLHAYFDCITSADEVSRIKPDPEVYERTLEVLGLRPEQVAAFEDSPHGVTAAQRAGIYCVAVPNRVTRQLSLDHADFQLASFLTLPFAQLFGHLQAV